MSCQERKPAKERLDFIVGHISDSPKPILHSVAAALKEIPLGDGAFRMIAEHNGLTLCGRRVVEVLPRFTFDTAMYEHLDQFEEPKWFLCERCDELMSQQHAAEAARTWKAGIDLSEVPDDEEDDQ